MKLQNKLWIGLIALSPILLVSCQRTQTASAEQQATRFGEGGDPSAEVKKAGEAATEEMTKTVEDAVEEIKPSGRNRFGFGGGDSDAPVKPLRRDTTPQIKKEIEEVKREIAPPPIVKKEFKAPQAPAPPIPPVTPPPAPPAPSTDGVVKLGFANAVPGDNLHVKLPGEFASLGPISIERMDSSGNALGSPWARGTQMQIPNPNQAGGKIYFKVP